MNAKRLRALALVLPLALFVALCAAGCGGGDHHHGGGHEYSEDEVGQFICPPCGMKMAADTELVELGGLKFALCSELCGEKIAESPQRYAKYAVQ